MLKSILRKIILMLFMLSITLPVHTGTTKAASSAQSPSPVQPGQPDPGPYKAFIWTFKLTFPDDTLKAEWWLLKGWVVDDIMVAVDDRIVLDVSSNCEVFGDQEIFQDYFIFDGSNYIQCTLPSFTQMLLQYYGVQTKYEFQVPDYWVAAQIYPMAPSEELPAPPLPPRQQRYTAPAPTGQQRYTVIDGEHFTADYGISKHGIAHRLRLFGNNYTVPVMQNGFEQPFAFVSGFGVHLFPLLHDTYGLWIDKLPDSLRDAITLTAPHGYLYWDDAGNQEIQNGWSSNHEDVDDSYTMTFGCTESGTNCFQGSAKAFVFDPGARAH